MPRMSIFKTGEGDREKGWASSVTASCDRAAVDAIAIMRAIARRGSAAALRSFQARS
jgi:hypothetical protein